MKNEYVDTDQPKPTWQPIETAPRDGTCILMLRNHNAKDRMIVGKWSSAGYFTAVGASTSAYACTHWMPLPEPPK